MTAEQAVTEPITNESQDTYFENRDPTEIGMCVILASAYLGLAKYCWEPLRTADNWKLWVNVEGFFITIALVALMVGLRPYLSPSSLQISSRGIKYRGPYWLWRKTVNWEQVVQIYVSSELLIILYKPKLDSQRQWPMLIASVYLADKENIPETINRYCPVTPTIMTNPAIYSRIAMGCLFLILVLWILELLMN
jgi:hypothetical protein